LQSSVPEMHVKVSNLPVPVTVIIDTV
jgi:hypothetical protein